MLRQTTKKLALSLLGTALVGDLFAIILVFSFSIIISKLGVWALYCVFILNLVIYFLFVYIKAWEEGFRDPTRVQYKRMEKMIGKGAVAGLLADIPFALFYVLLVVTHYTAWNADVFALIFNFLNMPFNFFFNLPAFKSMPWLNFTLLLPLPAIAQLGYYLGYRQISLTHRLVYKKEAKK